MFTRLLKDERGATAIEYGTVAMSIAVAMVMAFTSLGLNLADIFNTILDAFRGARRQGRPQPTGSAFSISISHSSPSRG